MFQDNQTSLDLRQPELRFGLSSQLIISLDDISFSGNQSSCSFFIDILLANTVLFAPTVRTSDNRFQEGLKLPLGEHDHLPELLTPESKQSF